MRVRPVSVARQRDGRYFVSTYSKATNGFNVLDGLPLVLPAETTARQLGEAVIEGLGRVREGLPAYDNTRDDPAAELVRFAGASNYADYCRGVRQVMVQTDPDVREVNLAPQQSAGRNGGFTSLEEYRRKFVLESPEQLGEAVLEAFEHATAWPR